MALAPPSADASASADASVSADASASADASVSADASASADASGASSVSSAATLYPRAEAGTPRAEPVCGEGLSPRSASGGQIEEQDTGHAENVEIARIRCGIAASR